MTPMLRQYLSIKEKLKDAILFFRLGDFYEMFFEDAQKAAAILDITLTSRDGGSAGKVPMCGIPYHAARGYINRLTREGLKVAICEQMEDPRAARGIVKREVVRIITPGTNLEDDELTQAHNSYIAACCRTGGVWGISYLDLSTGDFKLTELEKDEDLLNEICRLHPRELIVAEGLKENRTFTPVLAQAGPAVVNHYPEWIFDPEEAGKNLERQFGLKSLEGLGLSSYSAGIGAAGALLYFLKDNLLTSLGHLRRPLPYRSSQYMMLDRRTQRNLELVESLSGDGRSFTLFSVLNKTLTPMGGRLLAQWIKQPLLSPHLIRERHAAIDDLLANRDGLITLPALLKPVRDMERLLSRIACGVCSARELVAMKDSLKAVPAIKSALACLTSPLLADKRAELLELGELIVLIEKAIVDDPPFSVKEGGIIRQHYHAGLDELRGRAGQGKQWIADFQANERQRTGIKSLKVQYNRVFGYYIEITRPNLSLAPADYIRKQTMVNAERFITAELKEWEDSILGAEEKANALEQTLFEEVRQELLTYVPHIQRIAEALALVDVLFCLARVALSNSYVKPDIDEGPAVTITGGRHPVVERVLDEGRFVSNDTALDQAKNQLLIITGPNMAGKSTYIRQVALIVIMAQMGSFVPAEAARIGLVDTIYTRIGANENLARGESTFMVEMLETSNILNNAGPRSLVILDEIGRGTSTFDGVSIAWAVCEFLNKKSGVRPKTLFATHFHELGELERSLEGIRNYNITARESGDEIVFMRKIVPGVADKSYGIQVGRLAGLPEEVVQRSKEVLLYLEEEKISEEALAKKLSTRRRRETVTPLPLFNHRGAANAAERPELKRTPQSAAFPGADAVSHPILEEIRQLNLEAMTPLEALNHLHALRQKLLAASPLCPQSKNSS